MPEANETVIRRFIGEVINNGDFSVLDELDFKTETRISNRYSKSFRFGSETDITRRLLGVAPFHNINI